MGQGVIGGSDDINGFWSKEHDHTVVMRVSDVEMALPLNWGAGISAHEALGIAYHTEVKKFAFTKILGGTRRIRRQHRHISQTSRPNKSMYILRFQGFR